VGAVLGGAVVLPPTREVIQGYAEYAVKAPEELTMNASLMPAPPAPFIPADLVGKPVFMVLVCYTGDPEEGEQAIAPLRELATPLADAVAAMPYPAMFAFTEVASNRHGAAVRSTYANALTDETVDAMIAAMDEATSPVCMIQIRGLGGAMARVPEETTAFAHRNAPLMVSVIAAWLDPADDERRHRAWTESVWAQIQEIRAGVYSNFLGDEGEERIQEAYPEKVYRRLAEVKRVYDPENIFRFNQNIRP
jgi:hypothetical protein